MPISRDSQGFLLKGSPPRSRKSLAATSGVAPPIKRKRAHSIAPGENFQLESSRRRSSLRPSKGILKPFTQADVTQDSFQDDSNTLNIARKLDSNVIPDSSDINRTAVLGDFQTNIHDNTSRKSLGGRRVSFAATAHVRVFESADQNTNGTSSPASSPASSPMADSVSQQTAVDPLPTNDLSRPDQDDSLQSPSRRASTGSRRRSHANGHISGHEDGGEGEESMDVSADEIPAPIVSPIHSSVLRIASHDQDDLSEDAFDKLNNNEDDIDGNMSMTGDFGAGIISRRQTLTADSRRKSRMRSSIAIPPSEAGIIPTEFVVSMDRPSPPETAAFKALEAMVNGEKLRRPDDEEEVDMDVTTAVTRLLAVRNSTGGEFDNNNVAEASFTTTEDSFEGVDAGDRTINMTTLTGVPKEQNYDTDNECDINMSLASVVGDHSSPGNPSVVTDTVLLSKSPPSIPKVSRTSLAPSIPVPVFTKSFDPPIKATPSIDATTRHTATASPTKRPITAAFAPATQVVKRTVPPTSQDGTGATSPNKKRAIAVSESSSQRIPVPVKPVLAGPLPSLSKHSSPKKTPSTNGRRPSGYFRKGKAIMGADTVTNNISPTASRRRRSVSHIVRPPSATKNVPVTPTVRQGTPGSPPSFQNEHGDRLTLSVPTPPHEIDGSMAPTHVDNTNLSEWVSAVDVTDTVPEEDDLDPISVDQFFNMTGIRFMDDLTCPRRSTIHPSQLQWRESNDGEGEETFPLAAYAVAMAVDLAQLETMLWIANDIRSAIDKYKAQYRQTEEDAAKDIPFLFREFVTAPEEDREQILYVLKLIKAHTILSAKASWYEWKRGWVQGLQTNAARALDNLDADERQLSDIADRAGQLLPSLQNEYDSIMRELEQERAAVADIENCDQTFLSELKSTIAEQRRVLDVYRNDIADSKSKVARLETTLEELEAEAIDTKKAISTAQRQMDMQGASTRAEVFRLRDELRSLQDIHLWRATQLRMDLVEFIYDSKYRVIVPCRRSSPMPEALSIIPVDLTKNDSDDFPLLTGYMYTLARRFAIQKDTKLTLRTILQRLTDFWASYAQIRWQLSFLVIKYPLTCRLLPSGSSSDVSNAIEATATLLLVQKTSKVLVTFHFDDESLSNWPIAVNSLQYRVSVIYGQADHKGVHEAIRMRLLEANAEANHACLVDACMEVVSRYS